MLKRLITFPVKFLRYIHREGLVFAIEHYKDRVERVFYACFAFTNESINIPPCRLAGYKVYEIGTWLYSGKKVMASGY